LAGAARQRVVAPLVKPELVAEGWDATRLEA